MKIYTIEDLKNFERDKNGRLICPSGDYSLIKEFSERCSFGEKCSFGKRCSFGEGCSFGEWCSFGERCSFGEGIKYEGMSETTLRFLKIDRIGSRLGCTYFFKTATDIYVRCGCFFGTIADFEKKVNETHARNKKYRKEYLEAIKYVKAVM